MIVEFLGDIEKSKLSTRTRNNALAGLSSAFNHMIDMELMETNPAKRIKKLKTNPTLHKIYTKEQALAKANQAEQINPNFLLLLRLIAYQFLRPITINRMKVDWIDTDRDLIWIHGSQVKKGKTEVIPLLDPVKEDLYRLIKGAPKDYYVFGPGFKPSPAMANQWYYSKKFKRIKDELGLDKEHTMYGLRHTFITEIFKSLLKTENKETALTTLQEITRHSTRSALLSYLREVGVVLPKDYSGHMRFDF